jgi:hypothetical protein
MLEAIANARHSVTLASYIFDRDAVGLLFAEALEAAVRRGVAVRVLVDATGAYYSWPTITGTLRKRGIPARAVSSGPALPSLPLPQPAQPPETAGGRRSRRIHRRHEPARGPLAGQVARVSGAGLALSPAGTRGRPPAGDVRGRLAFHDAGGPAGRALVFPARTLRVRSSPAASPTDRTRTSKSCAGPCSPRCRRRSGPCASQPPTSCRNPP